ncbi:HAMP domain-containing protein [Roseovarius sp. MBR-78]|jgi:HAMP domain-containing protein|uniref:SapC family protein n=1 Tax=Roseovarius sp. MBR-78 TaxID=3156460 RepID=UPI0033909B19
MNAGTQNGQIAISKERHGGRFWRRFASYGFARDRHSVPIVLAELESAASAFPIVFRATATGTVEPHTLLHLNAGEPSPFVTPDGKWRGTYVPSLLRAHPFAASPTGAGGEMALLVDEASGLVTDDPRDEPFFDDSGAPSEALGQVIAFFRTRAQSELATQTACAALQAAGLLRALDPLPGMGKNDAAGCLAIDINALDAIDDAALPGLWQSGALRLAHAHRVSLFHAGWMARALRAGADATPRAPGHTAAPTAGLSGFLDALADAQDHERGTR